MKVRAWLSHSAPMRNPFAAVSSSPAVLAAPASSSPGPHAEAPSTTAPMPESVRRAVRREGR